MEGKNPSSDTGWNLQASTVPPQSLNSRIIEAGRNLWMSNLLIRGTSASQSDQVAQSVVHLSFSVSLRTEIP